MTTVCPGLLYAGDEVKVQLEGRQAVNTQENSQCQEIGRPWPGRQVGPTVRVTRGSEVLYGEALSKPSLSESHRLTGRMEKSGETAAGRRLGGEDGSWGKGGDRKLSWKSGVYISSKKKKSCSGLFVSLKDFPFADGAARQLCEVHC